MDKLDTLSGVGAALVLLAGIGWGQLVARMDARRREQARAPTTWVGRHLVHEGSVVGEVVAADGQRVVVRRAGDRLAFPRASVREQGLDLALRGDLDEAEARRLAEGSP